MIIRILNEGQYDVDDAELNALNVLDEKLETAVGAGDEAGFRTALAELLEKVRTAGSPVAMDELVPSELALPPADATIDEVRDLLDEEGLIPGRSADVDAAAGADS